MKFKTGPWEKKKEILSTLGSNLSLMDKKLSVSLENSLAPLEVRCPFASADALGVLLLTGLVPMKTVSLVSNRVIAQVRTAKNPVNKTEIEQSLALSQSMLPVRADVRKNYIICRRVCFSVNSANISGHINASIMQIFSMQRMVIEPVIVNVFIKKF